MESSVYGCNERWFNEAKARRSRSMTDEDNPLYFSTTFWELNLRDTYLISNFGSSFESYMKYRARAIKTRSLQGYV